MARKWQSERQSLFNKKNCHYVNPYHQKKIERLPANAYSFEWGKAAGQRTSTGVFTYDKPKDQIPKNHNKEALSLLSTKQAQMILDYQSVGTGYILLHKLKVNFFDFYEEFVKANKTSGNRHLKNSLTAFRDFVEKDYISASEITEDMCERFRNYLLTRYNGETPADYFYRFKRVIKAAFESTGEMLAL